MNVAVASDHRGVRVKGQILSLLSDLGHNGIDLGPAEAASVDYPDFAQKVAECVGRGEADRGVGHIGLGYRLSAETLARPKPAVKTDDVESALRHLDGHRCVFQRMGQIWVLKYEGDIRKAEDELKAYLQKKKAASPPQDDKELLH